MGKPQVTVTSYDHDGNIRFVNEFATFDEMAAYYKNVHDFDERRKNEPEDGCWNCMNFDWRREACTVNWNNMDESYYNPNTDDRNLTDYCEYHETDPDADPECLEFGGNEP